MNAKQTNKRGGALIATAKVFVITASLAATVGGWAAMSAPVSAATTASASTSNPSASSSGGLGTTLAQIFSASPSSVQSQPAVRTRSSR